MKKITALVLSFLLVISITSCGGEKKEFELQEMNATEVLEMLKDNGFPLDEITSYTEKTDPNTLMNKDGQYTSKAFVHDSRIKDDMESGIDVEVFKTEADAKDRKDYIDSFSDVAFLSETSFVNGKVLLRVSNDLTKTEAEEYGKALEDMAKGIKPTYNK